MPQIDVNQSVAVLLVPTLEEVNKAIASLSIGKAPGSDEIPSEIFMIIQCVYRETTT